MSCDLDYGAQRLQQEEKIKRMKGWMSGYMDIRKMFQREHIRNRVSKQRKEAEIQGKNSQNFDCQNESVLPWQLEHEDQTNETNNVRIASQHQGHKYGI